MKKNKILLLASISLFLMIVASAPTQAQLLPTKLTVTVVDGLGNITQGAEVKLYDTEEDYRASTNPLFTAFTDSKGRAKFKDLESRSYFLEVKKGDLNNNGEGVQTGVLAVKRNNKVNVVIE